MDNDEVETRSIMLRIRMLPSLKAKLERLAAALHRSMSNYLEALIREQPSHHHLRRGSGSEGGDQRDVQNASQSFIN